jgi:hypothetical protein
MQTKVDHFKRLCKYSAKMIRSLGSLVIAFGLKIWQLHFCRWLPIADPEGNTVRTFIFFLHKSILTWREFLTAL